MSTLSSKTLPFRVARPDRMVTVSLLEDRTIPHQTHLTFYSFYRAPLPVAREPEPRPLKEEQLVPHMSLCLMRLRLKSS